HLPPPRISLPGVAALRRPLPLFGHGQPPPMARAIGLALLPAHAVDGVVLAVVAISIAEAARPEALGGLAPLGLGRHRGAGAEREALRGALLFAHTGLVVGH